MIIRCTSTKLMIAMLAALATAACHSVPENVSSLPSQSSTRALLPILTASHIEQTCTTQISALQAEVDHIAAQPLPTAADTRAVLAEWDHLQTDIEDFQGPFGVLSSLSPDQSVRSAAEACDTKTSEFSTALMQNEGLYRRLKVLRADDDIDQKMLKDTLDDFEDSGIDLQPSARQRLKTLQNLLAVQDQEFERNIRDNKDTLTLTPAQMQGLPQAYLQRAKRDAAGNYLLGFAVVDYQPFMEFADDAAARKSYMIAFNRRGTPKNIDLLNQIVQERKEAAALFNQPSYADFVLRRRMAKTPGAVYAFLDDVRQAVTEQQEQELKDLQAFRAAAEHISLYAATIHPWDVAYWQRKLKIARFDFDSDSMRRYFPATASIKWVMGVSSTLYDIDFHETTVPTWNADVRYFDVIDRLSGKILGGIYIDPFPRAGKYTHAAVIPVRHGSTLTGRRPIAVLMTNLQPAGLTPGELETLIHEFGHALHGVLSQTRYASQSGTSVERDFVEAPSQMYEAWARRAQPLKLVADYCDPACPRVDDALVKKMDAAHRYGRGMAYARQLLYATYDMKMHGPKPGDALQTWIDVESATPLGHVNGTMFPGTFGHIAGGYAAGYYGYMWSEVLALDMLSRFTPDMLDPVVGANYRATILSRGSEQLANVMVRRFLGRDPNSHAFFAELNGNPK
jgi:thimet oligopeptidase